MESSITGSDLDQPCMKSIADNTGPSGEGAGIRVPGRQARVQGKGSDPVEQLDCKSGYQGGETVSK